MYVFKQFSTRVDTITTRVSFEKSLDRSVIRRLRVRVFGPVSARRIREKGPNFGIFSYDNFVRFLFFARGRIINVIRTSFRIATDFIMFEGLRSKSAAGHETRGTRIKVVSIN